MRVDPIPTLKDVNAIRKLLHDKPRDLLLFNLGVGSGIRCGDLLKLKISDVINCKINDKIVITESKTKKVNYIIITKTIYKAIENYLNSLENINPDHYLFKSRKGRNYPISIFYVGLLVKKWASEINLKGNFGAHSLRKCWATVMFKEHHVPIQLISRRLSHSSESITRRYVGIMESDIENILKTDI